MAQISSFFGTVNDNYVVDIDINNGYGEFMVPGFNDNRSSGIFIKQLNFVDYNDDKRNSTGAFRCMIFKERRTDIKDKNKQEEFYNKFMHNWNLLQGRYIFTFDISFFNEVENDLYVMEIVILSDFMLNLTLNEYIINECRVFLKELEIDYDFPSIDLLDKSTYPSLFELLPFSLNLNFFIIKPLNFVIEDKVMKVTFGNIFNGPEIINFRKSEIYESKDDDDWNGNELYLDSGIPFFYLNSVISKIVKSQIYEDELPSERYLTCMFGFMANIFHNCLQYLIDALQTNTNDLFIELPVGFYDQLLIGSFNLIQSEELIIEEKLKYVQVVCLTNDFRPTNKLYAKSDILFITSDNIYFSTIADKNSFHFDGIFYIGPSYFMNWNSDRERRLLMVKPDQINPFKINVNKFLTGLTQTNLVSNIVPVTGKLTMEIRFVNIVNPVIYDNFQATWK